MIKEFKTYWKSLKLYKKIVFLLGFLSTLQFFLAYIEPFSLFDFLLLMIGFLFWVTLLIVSNSSGEEKFWNLKTFKAVYIFGWINLPILIIEIPLFFWYYSL